MALEQISLDELLGRLASRRRPGDALASDGDGTLWDGDIGEALFETALARSWLREEARAALASEARAHGVEASGDATAIAGRLYAAQKEGCYPDERAYPMQAWCYAGFEEAALEPLCSEVLDAWGFEEAVRPLARAVMAFAREGGHALWLVSASPAPIVRLAAERLGLDRRQVVAMEPRLEGGVYWPQLASEPTHAEGKVRRLRLENEAPLLLAMGNSLYDAPLIRHARLGVAVTPSRALREALSDTSALVIA